LSRLARLMIDGGFRLDSTSTVEWYTGEEEGENVDCSTGVTVSWNNVESYSEIYIVGL
jgi:hypothetical protein